MNKRSVDFILTLHNFYITIRNYLYELFVWVVVYYSRMCVPPTRIAYANAGKRDVTFALEMFYAIENVQSCASLIQWLRRFDVTHDTIDLFYVRDNRLCCINIDLCDKTANNCDLQFGKIDFATLAQVTAVML